MEVAAYLYPWDVVGDPAAADVVAGLGLHHITLAAVHHAVRAVTPRHPGHRFMVAPHTAAFYPPSPRRWAGRSLAPVAAPWTAVANAFAATVAVLAAELPVHAWVVVNHVDPAAPNNATIVNAYGDRYPWALCPAQDAVREYAIGLADDIAELPGISGVELEAFGWYGFDHDHAHDTAGHLRLTDAQRYLLSVCFCAACKAEYRSAGASPGELRARIRAALEPAFIGQPRADPPRDTGHDSPGVDETAAAIDALLGADLSEVVQRVRSEIADAYHAAVVARLRASRPELTVLAHASPHPYQADAFTGLHPETAHELFDGLVVDCWSDLDALVQTRARARADLPVYASLLTVAGLGGRPATLPKQAEAARVAGATGIRLYHAGLAGPDDLAAIRELTRAGREAAARRSGDAERDAA